MERAERKVIAALKFCQFRSGDRTLISLIIDAHNVFGNLTFLVNFLPCCSDHKGDIQFFDLYRQPCDRLCFFRVRSSRLRF